jgi:thiol-disulfide isomerase/thioredoxin
LTTAHPPRRRRGDRKVIGPFTVRHVSALGVAAAVLGFVLLALTTPLVGGPTPSMPVPGASFFPVGDPVEGLQPGERAPELEGTVNGQTVQLLDLDGNPIRLADLRGKVIWLNFWASWCPPCQEETPVLRELHAELAPHGLELIAVSVQESTIDDVRRYAETYALDYTIGFDATSAIFKTYRAFGLPTQLFIDGDGVIRHVVLGPVTRDSARAILRPMLGLPGVSPTASSSPSTSP